MKVLIVSKGYLPGYRFGGPVRSLSALVEQLGDRIEFSVVTSDRDLGSSHPYPGIRLDSWQQVGKASVFYSSATMLSPLFWKEILESVQPDILYLSSIMWPVTSTILLWRKMHIIPQVPVILAPCGEFAPSALSLKSFKKRVFLTCSEWIRLHAGLVWQASSDSEAEDIQSGVSTAKYVVVAPDLRTVSKRSSIPLPKESGEARFVWLGRIAPVKNLIGALEYLGSIPDSKATFEVFGPIEDPAYWSACRDVAARLPADVAFAYRGELAHDAVSSALSQYHFLLFPTHGENFGHSIAEALDQGLPVLVSDQTPWRGLEASGVGWDVPLDRSDEWKSVIQHCIAMDDTEYQAMSERCKSYVDIWLQDHGGLKANLRMFSRAMACKGPCESP